jgi:hypothetical protein
MEKLTCSGAKQFDLVEYMASLGHHPQKITNQDYWYRSPLRDEKTASFKVDRRQNVWYDHGLGKGGNLVDFGTLYFKCTIKDLLERLATYRPSLNFSFHQPLAGPSSAGEKKEPSESKIVILEVRPLTERSLLEYLEERKIPLSIATAFCKEVDFVLYGKKRTVIGFKNNAGGYELRSPGFKGSSSPKGITFLDNSTLEIAVFEGFFNFLSFCTINKDKQDLLTNCLVLNSLAFLEKSRPLMEQYQQVHLILDRDAAGINQTRKAMAWDPEKYIDRSDFYQGHKDLNDYLKQGTWKQQSLQPKQEDSVEELKKRRGLKR